MSLSIRTLPDSIINKIAAGEVVERPASAVKELVENSLDAGATEVHIEAQDGGKKLIQVQDNGSGIASDQLQLAIARHATSKIYEVDDLFQIRTMGFRGEALASMASVSKMMITSRADGDCGRELAIEGGEIISDHEAGHAVGTTVQIRYLFYQTPARLKFLKTAETENAHIVEILTRLALVHPTVGFTYNHNGKNHLNVRPADLKQRIEQVFGKEISDQCFEISHTSSGMEINGFAGHPNISRSHNRNLYCFVNGRAVRDKVATHAIFEGYRDLLMRGRYPFIVLFIKLPGEMVDVNVHPAKSEVRFSNSQVVHRLVYEAVRLTLQAEPWKREQMVEQLNGCHGRGGPPARAHPALRAIGTEFDFRLGTESGRARPGEEVGTAPVHQECEYDKSIVGSESCFYSELTLIGQVLSTFILCQTEGKLVLIDQHAAHERIGFERLLSQYHQGIPSEIFLIPEHFDLSLSESEILKQYLGDLMSFGWEIEFFGGNTFVVKQKPFLLKDRVDTKKLMLDLIGDVLEKGELVSLKDKVHHVLATMACHGAIRANHSLSREEMVALLKDLDAYPNTSFCPHGRPVSIEVTRDELDRWFKRVL